MNCHPIAAFVTAAAVAGAFSGCGLGTDDEPKSERPSIGREGTGAATAPGRDASDQPVEIYFTAGEQFLPVERELPDSGRRLPAALNQLLAGPTDAERKRGLGTAIPSGTKVLSESFDASTGIASIRFNSRFIYTRRTVRTRADAIEEYRGRAGEVVFTATSLPEVTAARLSVPGREPVTLRRAGFAEPAKPPKTKKPPPPRGPKPTDIRGIQRALANLRYLPTSAVNGRYDDRTKQAIMAFQSWNGLDRDGVGGPKTTASLRTAGIPKPGARTAARRIEIYRRKGVMLLISGGRVQRAIHTSTGRGGDSPDFGTPPPVVSRSTAEN